MSVCIMFAYAVYTIVCLVCLLLHSVCTCRDSLGITHTSSSLSTHDVSFLLVYHNVPISQAHFVCLVLMFDFTHYALINRFLMSVCIMFSCAVYTIVCLVCLFLHSVCTCRDSRGSTRSCRLGCACHDASSCLPIVGVSIRCPLWCVTYVCFYTLNVHVVIPLGTRISSGLRLSRRKFLLAYRRRVRTLTTLVCLVCLFLHYACTCAS